MPGRIIQGIHQAGANNPVFMMDEVDKIGADFRGDPSSALLEVLDPEQNNSLPRPLPGRALRPLERHVHLHRQPDRHHPARLPRPHGGDPALRLHRGREARDRQAPHRAQAARGARAHPRAPASSPTAALRSIINSYTREAGLRNLEREVAAISRKVARKVAEGRPSAVRVTPPPLHKYLGAPKILPEERLKKDEVGIATGLAWTATGGDVLFVEATAMRGKGTAHPHRPARRRHEGVGPGRALLRTQPRRASTGSSEDFFAQPRPARARPRGRDPEGRALRGHHHGHRHDLGLHQPARSGAAVAMTGEITLRGNVLPDRRPQGEDPGRAPGRHRRRSSARSSTRRSWTRCRRILRRGHAVPPGGRGGRGAEARPHPAPRAPAGGRGGSEVPAQALPGAAPEQAGHRLARSRYRDRRCSAPVVALLETATPVVSEPESAQGLAAHQHGGPEIASRGRQGVNPWTSSARTSGSRSGSS